MSSAFIANERGSVMNIALLILIMLTMIVVFMSRTSTTNVQIATNERLATAAFFGADSGAYGGAKIVSWMMDNGKSPTVNGAGKDFPRIDMIVDENGTCLYDLLMGFPPNAGCAGKTPDAIYNADGTPNPAFSMTTDAAGDEAMTFGLGSRNVKVAIDFEGTEQNSGGGAGFAEGDQGAGAGGASAISKYYTILAMADAPKNSVAEVELQYRKIPETGGL